MRIPSFFFEGATSKNKTIQSKQINKTKNKNEIFGISTLLSAGDLHDQYRAFYGAMKYTCYQQLVITVNGLQQTNKQTKTDTTDMEI